MSAVQHPIDALHQMLNRPEYKDSPKEEIARPCKLFLAIATIWNGQFWQTSLVEATKATLKTLGVRT